MLLKKKKKAIAHLVLEVFTPKMALVDILLLLLCLCKRNYVEKTGHLYTAEQVFFSCTSFFGLHEIMQGNLCSCKNTGKI